MNTLQQTTSPFLSYQKSYNVSNLCPTFFTTLYLLILGNDCCILFPSQDCLCLHQSSVTGKMQKDRMKFNCLANVDPNVMAQMPEQLLFSKQRKSLYVNREMKLIACYYQNAR